jgi:hypothetical protein
MHYLFAFGGVDLGDSFEEGRHIAFTIRPLSRVGLLGDRDSG